MSPPLSKVVVHVLFCTSCVDRNGKNLADFTYVHNVVFGHVLAAEKLQPGAKICGKVRH